MNLETVVSIPAKNIFLEHKIFIQQRTSVKKNKPGMPQVDARSKFKRGNFVDFLFNFESPRKRKRKEIRMRFENNFSPNGKQQKRHFAIRAFR